MSMLNDDTVVTRKKRTNLFHSPWYLFLLVVTFVLCFLAAYNYNQWKIKAMSARAIIEEVSETTGVDWNENSIIEILCEYIDNQMDDAAFEDFCKRRAEEELLG